MNLFHYTSPGAARGLLSNGEVWASKIQHLNDEKEYVQYIEHIERVSRSKFDVNCADESAFLDDLHELTASLRSANIFVTSFTEEADLLSQWRGYCPSGGYSIGFSSEQLASVIETSGLFFGKARYSLPEDRKTAALLESAFRDYRRIYVADSLDEGRLGALDQIANEILNEGPRFKHPGFSEEKEWRLYSSILSWSDSRLDVVDIRGRLRPIIRVPVSLLRNGAGLDGVCKITRCVVSPGPDARLRREGLMFLLRKLDLAYERIDTSSTPYNPR